MKKLLILEGSGKIPQVKKELNDSSFTIIATGGHFREMDEKINNGYGFNFIDFIPKWKPTPKKANVIKTINDLAKTHDIIYVAGDPDREGEAISWHIYDILTAENKKKAKRIVFSEIIKSAIMEGIANARSLDQNLVNAQFGRAVLDKYFGYRASRVVQNKIGARSAGRVQSMALRLIEEREREIENFVEKKWYVLEPDLTGNIKSVNKRKVKDKWETIKYDSLPEAQAKFNSLNKDYIIESISEPKIEFQKPPVPFDTPTALKLADKFNINTKIMQETILQKMYEQGLTTYPRTDSFRIKDEVVDQIKNLIKKQYGQNYVCSGVPHFNTKKIKGEQGGHDALRPTDINKTPQELKTQLDAIHPKAYLVYETIRNRTIASCMSDAQFKKVEIVFDNKNEKFVSVSKTLIFDGFKKVFNPDDFVMDPSEIEDLATIDISKIKVGEKLQCIKPEIAIKVHSTSKPKRYTEATLVDTLKRKEIGRPSTFATMVSINLEKGNVEKTADANGLNPVASPKGKYLFPNALGRKAATYCIEKLDTVINEKYTKQMEEELDKIADGKMKWVDDFIRPFYNLFEKYYNQLMSEQAMIHKPLNEKCPKCGASLVEAIIKGKTIKKCSTNKWNPKTKKAEGCDYVDWNSGNGPKVEAKPDPKNPPCSKCGGQTILRKGKNKQGKKYEFYGCANYPKCDGIVWKNDVKK